MKKILIGLLVMALVIAPTMLLTTGCRRGNDDPAHFNFVVTNATVPVNQAALALWDDEDTLAGRTYFWYGRRDTFDRVDKIGERFNLLGYAGVNLMSGFPDGQMDIIGNRMAELYKDNSENTFTLYVTDTGLNALLRIIFVNNIPMENIRIVFLEGGVNSVPKINNVLNRANWEEHIAPWNTRLEALINQASTAGTIGSFAYPGFGYTADYPLMVSFAMMFDNVEWWTQAPAAVFTAEHITDEMIKSLGILPVIEGTTQSAAHLMQLANALIYREGEAGFREAMFGDAVYSALNPADDRPVLMFMGTSPNTHQEGQFNTGGNINGLEAVLNNVIRLYGATHNIVFKGHPAWPVLDGWDNSVNWRTQSTRVAFDARVDFLDGLMDRTDINFSIIPCQIPADMILLFFTETALDLGGFNSTLFTVAGEGSPHRVLFFVTYDPGNPPAHAQPVPPHGILTLSGPVLTMFLEGEFDRDGQSPIILHPGNIATITRPAHH
ncbi:MAG: hypothetical protein FWE31_04755 [Firmicutes bacterium]|nr:hypothetical protein [Bacillota bacterium]